MASILKSMLIPRVTVFSSISSGQQAQKQRFTRGAKLPLPKQQYYSTSSSVPLAVTQSRELGSRKS